MNGMDWEKSKALTLLKRDFIKVFFEKTSHFYLTGGSALGIFYLEHRSSYDLDFFTQDQVDWHILSNTLLDIAQNIHAVCSALISTPLFYRFQLVRGEENEILDFVIEKSFQIDKEKNKIGSIRLDTLREIGVNKIATLISRCELKDVVDLYFLQKKGFSIIDNFSDAKKKDGGLEPAMVSFLLSQLTIDRVPDYLIEPVSADQLKAFVNDLRKKMAELSFPEEAGIK